MTKKVSGRKKPRSARAKDVGVPLREMKRAELERLAELGRAEAYVIHDIRSPLVTVGLLARSVLNRSKLKKKDAEALKTICEQVNHCDALLRDCMAFVGPAKGKKAPVEVTRLLSGVRRALMPIARASGVAIALDCEKAKDARILCVRTGLRRALMNMAQNSLESMSKTGGLLTLAWRATPKWVTVTVQDSGPGMDPATAENVFVPFFSRKKGGTGLGLALAKRIIEEHGGGIQVKSTPGKGTTFNIRLPRHTGGEGRKK